MDALSGMRNEYRKGMLDESGMDPDPYVQFGLWMDEAVNAGIDEPNAMALATVSGDGLPSARMLLLKGFDKEGFLFYTNYESRKGLDLEANPGAALLFFWKELERQVRIEGRVTRLPESESLDYIRSRPRESQIAALVSPQSRSIPGRHVLEAEKARIANDYAGCDIPRPQHWGGYCLRPLRMEFWQGRESRLHDRILYTFENQVWSINRLAP